MNTLTLRKIIETSKGLLKIEPKVRASDAYSLSLIYTPGVRKIRAIMKIFIRLDRFALRSKNSPI